MTQKKEIYRAKLDETYQLPYIDLDEERERELPDGGRLSYRYLHGGFEGTGVKFILCFPKKESFQGRFFQYLSPFPGPDEELASLERTGEDDKIGFALTHGAYYVVSNQGGFVMNDAERLYRSSANTAVYSRKVTQRVYGYEHRPYGYVFGGSGGSFKTMSCMEMTEGVWDGAVPYVLANPMATPNVFAPRVRAMRLLGEEGLKKVVDAMEPGGSGDIYEGLDAVQRQALEEATRMGFPKRGWFCWPFMGDGALMVLAPYIYNIFPEYFTDFWTKPGYEGADPEGSAARDRVQFQTRVKGLAARKQEKEGEFNSVDNSWMNTLVGNQQTPLIRMEELPPEDAYLFHCRLRVLDGEAAGVECPIDSIEDGVITVSNVFNGHNIGNPLEGLKAGDRILVDNSDYLAMQTFHRHQVPDASYRVYDQFRDGDGKPLYPQLPYLVSPIIALNGGGSLPSGRIHGRMIVLCSILDESAYAWHGDWYREAVRENSGMDLGDCFRLYYNDHCIHDDRAGYLDDPQHQVDYIGILHQALLDLADWCEHGIAPCPDTRYTVEDGQVEVPEKAAERGGLQPVVDARAGGVKSLRVKAGEEVVFTAEIQVPPGAGAVTFAAWDFEGSNDFEHGETLVKGEGQGASVRTTHVFARPGTYFPVIKVKSSRRGTLDDIFTQCKNLDRVRVVVES